MADEAEDREADADANATLQIPDNRDEEDETHEDEFGISAYADEEVDVVWRFFNKRICYYTNHSAKDAFGEVVEVWQHEDCAQDRDEGEEDGAHRRKTTSRGINLRSSVAAESRKCHEQAASNVGSAQCNELTVRRYGHCDALFGRIAAA